MRLIYSKNRFDILDTFSESDLDVLKKSLHHFFKQIDRAGNNYPVLVLDFSECKLRVNETDFQKFIIEMKALAQASQTTMTVAQSDIESMHAETLANEISLKAKLNVLENKLELIDSVKNQIEKLTSENNILREKINQKPSVKTARGLVEKFWGET